MIIFIKKATPQFVTIKLERTEYLSYLNSIKGRVYDKQFNTHNIPYVEFNAFKKLAEKFNNVFSGLELVNAIPNQPQISLAPKGLMVKNIDLYGITTNYKTEWRSTGNIFIVPRNEAYLFSEWVSYASPDAAMLINEQIKDREKLTQLDSAIVPSVKFNNTTLYPFQVQDVEKVNLLHGRVLLAHPVGLGKSVMSLRYIAEHGFRTVIVCPGFAKTNWTREIAKYLPDVSIKTLNGRTPQDHEIAYLFDKTIQFIIINYDILGFPVKDAHDNETYLWAELIKMAPIQCVVFDEAHKMGNHASQRSKAGRLLNKVSNILCLTASPFTNRVGELYPILNILRPEIFDNESEFSHQFADYQGRAKNVEHLHDVLKTIMIRRNKEDILPDLPAVNKITEYYELSEKADGYYKKVLEGIYFNLLSKSFDVSDGKQLQHILEEFLRLKQICAFDKVDFTSDLATKIWDSNEEKVIIFSQFIPAIEAISQRLGQEAEVITGKVSQSERTKIQDRFQDPNSGTRFIVGNPTAMGEALTLTQAKSIIFNDLLWNPLRHEQASGRAYGRLNDAHGIDEYWVIAQGTIEEKILELLWAKQVDFDRVIEGEDSEISGGVFMTLLNEMRRGR